MIGHRRIIQHPVKDLKFGDRLTPMLPEPFLSFDQFSIDFIGHPAVTLAQQTDEIWPAAFNLGETDRQHLTALGFLRGNPPAEINLTPRDPALIAQLAELRKDALDEFFAFGLHV